MSTTKENSGSHRWAALRVVASKALAWGSRPDKDRLTPAVCALAAHIDESHVIVRAGKLGGSAAQADAEQFAKDVHQGHYFSAGLDQLDGMYETFKFGLIHPMASAEARIEEISDETKLVRKTFNENLKTPAKGKLCK